MPRAAARERLSVSSLGSLASARNVDRDTDAGEAKEELLSSTNPGAGSSTGDPSSCFCVGLETDASEATVRDTDPRGVSLTAKPLSPRNVDRETDAEEADGPSTPDRDARSISSAIDLVSVRAVRERDIDAEGGIDRLLRGSLWDCAPSGEL